MCHDIIGVWHDDFTPESKYWEFCGCSCIKSVAILCARGTRILQDNNHIMLGLAFDHNTQCHAAVAVFK